MVNLATARRHFRDRVAEEGTEFWSDANILSYLNLAQNYVATVTRGVFEGSVDGVAWQELDSQTYTTGDIAQGSFGTFPL